MCCNMKGHFTVREARIERSMCNGSKLWLSSKAANYESPEMR